MRWFIRSLILSLTLTVACLALAAEESFQSGATDHMAVLMTFPNAIGPQDPSRPTYEEIEILLEEAEAKANTFAEGIKTLLSLSKKMQTDHYKRSLANSLQIPVATADEQLVLSIAHLDEKSRQRFLERKQKALRRFALFFRILKIKTGTINEMLSSINDTFYKRWSVIVNGRTVAIGTGVFAAPALSYSQFIRRQITRIPLFRNLPEDAGFYVATTLGLNFGATRTENGKLKIRIDPGLDHRVGDRFYTPFGIIGFGVNLTVTFEDRSESNLTFIQTRFLKTGMLTTFGNEKVFGFSIPIGVNLIPIAGVAAALSGTMSRLSFFDSENFHRILSYLHQFVASRTKTCRRLLK